MTLKDWLKYIAATFILAALSILGAVIIWHVLSVIFHDALSIRLVHWVGGAAILVGLGLVCMAARWAFRTVFGGPN